MGKISKYITTIRNFGILYFIQYHLIGRFKGPAYKRRIKQVFLSQHLCGHFDSEHRQMSTSDGRTNYPIWVCWWQGEDDMPEIIRACYSQILSQAPSEAQVHLITKDSLNSYLTLPEIITKRFKDGRISITHLSDIIRFSLLAEYGGLWVDASVYLSGALPTSLPDFLTIHQDKIDNKYVSDYKWTGYFIGGSDSSWLFTSIRNVLLSYWAKYDVLIDYFLLDYIIDMFYTSDDYTRAVIDNVPKNNPDNFFIQNNLNNEFDETAYNRICQRTYIHKLSWKGDYSLLTEDAKPTWYSHILFQS